MEGFNDAGAHQYSKKANFFMHEILLKGLCQGCHETQGYCKKPGECLCKSGYTGKQCTDCVRLPGCSQGYCKKGYECICKEGYVGLFCNEPVCREGCHPENGYCKKAGTCECRTGWQGTNCTECSVLPGCVHGTCSKPLECNCSTQYTGKLCSEPRCSESCSAENGYCTLPGECICRIGWQGPDCTECVKYPGCLNGYCTGPWDCICQKGWKGTKCDEIDIEALGGNAIDQDTPDDQDASESNGTEDVVLENKEILKENIEGRTKDHETAKEEESEDQDTKNMEANQDTMEIKLQEIEGRCNLNLSFRCMNGGLDICTFLSNGTRIGEPVCRCKTGFAGMYCQYEIDPVIVL